MTHFAQWLDLTMSNEGLSGRELAHLIGVHDSAVSRWRNGQGVPSVKILFKLASVLNVDPLRLQATAGFTPPEAEVEPLPLPPAHARREYVRQQLMNIKGLSNESLSRLLETYDREIAKERG